MTVIEQDVLNEVIKQIEQRTAEKIFGDMIKIVSAAESAGDTITVTSNDVLKIAKRYGVKL